MGETTRPTDPAADSGWRDGHARKAFFTDTSVCIGCKACEVACKQWNELPADSDGLLASSYDNSGGLGANTWRHVAFIEQDGTRIEQARESGRALVNLGMPSLLSQNGAESAGSASPDVLSAPHTFDDLTPPDTSEFRWLISSDVCKHCTHAGCLDACPTGALFRTEHGTVVVQDDICNGCGICVAACPFGVIESRPDGTAQPGERGEAKPGGIAQKCTMCYDRLHDGDTPACAQTCPTESIRYGTRDEMVARAHERVRELHTQGMVEARLYGANPNDGVGGTGSVFLLLDEPETYGLPPDPQVPTTTLPRTYARAGLAALGMLVSTVIAFRSKP